MSDEPEATPSCELDRAGVAMIIVIALVISPVTMLAAAWILTAGFDLASASPFDLVWVGITAFLVALVIRVGVRELRGGLGVRIDERGVARGSIELAWSEIDELEAPSFGLLELRGAGKSLCLRTYLYRNRRQLLEFISARTGKPVPEMLYSY